jgi:hypothetical protein
MIRVTKRNWRRSSQESSEDDPSTLAKSRESRPAMRFGEEERFGIG